jgi:hypothetical protein
MVFILALMASGVFGFMLAADTEEVELSIVIGALCGLLAGMALSVTKWFEIDFEAGGALLCIGVAGSTTCCLLPENSWPKRWFRTLL